MVQIAAGFDSATALVRGRSPRAGDVRSQCCGRWISILAAAGIPAERLDGRGHPCPRCGGRDRFAAWRDIDQRGAVHCRHCFTAGTEPRPGDGIATLRWWLNCDFATALDFAADHGNVAVSAGPMFASGGRAAYRSTPDAALRSLAERSHAAMRPGWWSVLSAKLSLPVETLKRLRIGWSATDRAITFPMVNSDRQVVGIRLRDLPTGRKWSVPGGRAGVFWPDGVSRGVAELWITEGPTDCAAALSIGLPAIGRDACGTSPAVLAEVVSALRPGRCMIVADPDDVGRRGAIQTAQRLATRVDIRIVAPPGGGDLREAIIGGRTAGDLNRSVVFQPGPIQRLLFDPAP